MMGMGKWMASCALAAMLCACGGGGDDQNTAALNINTSGSSAQTQSIATGKSGNLTVKSGDFLSLRTTEPVKWSVALTSAATTVINQTFTDTGWSGNLINPNGDTIALVATAVSDPSKVFKLLLTLQPAPITTPMYSAVPQKVGEVATFAETSLRLGGTGGTQRIAYTTSSITNGIATIKGVDIATNTPDQNYTQDQDRNRLTRTYMNNGNVCTYTPKRDYYNFPMYVGKGWNSTWNYGCAAGYFEKANVQANVLAFEPVTVAAGTYNALRINYVVTYTNSNDALLPNGSSGNATYSETITGWWSPDLGRFVKWVSNYGYATGFTNPTYMKVYTQELQSLQTLPQ